MDRRCLEDSIACLVRSSSSCCFYGLDFVDVVVRGK